MPTIESLDAEGLRHELAALTDILHACVHAGASVGFVLPFEPDQARAFWTDRVAPPLARGERRLLVARLGDQVIGTVQLDMATMPNQAHRAEVAKLLVHPRARRLGVARSLMQALEARAREDSRLLLTLDTRTGDLAEPLYQSMGYQLAGRIPGYARAPAGPGFDATSIYYKSLAD